MRGITTSHIALPRSKWKKSDTGAVASWCERFRLCGNLLCWHISHSKEHLPTFVAWTEKRTALPQFVVILCWSESYQWLQQLASWIGTNCQTGLDMRLAVSAMNTGSFIPSALVMYGDQVATISNHRCRSKNWSIEPFIKSLQNEVQECTRHKGKEGIGKYQLTVTHEEVTRYQRYPFTQQKN